MSATFNFKIITPERIVLDQKVEQVTAHSVDGELTVLAKHEPLVTALSVDILRYRESGEEKFAAVMGGLLEVSETEVTVISDLVELGHEIDEAEAHQLRDKAEAEKLNKFDQLDVYVAQMALSKAIARLKTVELMKAARKGRLN